MIPLYLLACTLQHFPLNSAFFVLKINRENRNLAGRDALQPERLISR